jgi:hypothetical protein
VATASVVVLKVRRGRLQKMAAECFCKILKKVYFHHGKQGVIVLLENKSLVATLYLRVRYRLWSISSEIIFINELFFYCFISSKSTGKSWSLASSFLNPIFGIFVIEVKGEWDRALLFLQLALVRRQECGGCSILGWREERGWSKETRNNRLAIGVMLSEMNGAKKNCLLAFQ